MNQKIYKNIGILGGGQLALMMLPYAKNLGLSISVLDPNLHAPCKGWCPNYLEGDFRDEKTVLEFGKSLDLLTIEIEDVNVSALKKLKNNGVEVRPSPETIEIIQDKGLQKKFLKDHGFPTSDFCLISNREELKQKKDYLPAMQKLRLSGYDGRGVYKVAEEKDIENAFDEPCVLEKLVDLQKEISVMVARNPSGEVKVFPIVEMIFNEEHNLLDFLSCPAKLTDKLEREAQSLAIRIADSLSLEGILAIEMFITKDNQILINEMAPRPHNSGHHTIEANVTSQFEQHLRAILDYPLGETALYSPAVMLNILGDDSFEGKPAYQGLDKALKKPGVAIHLYGKSISKPFRKMGHATVVNPNINDAEEIARLVKKDIKIVEEKND